MTKKTIDAAGLGIMLGTSGGLLSTGGPAVLVPIGVAGLGLGMLTRGRIPAPVRMFALGWSVTSLAGTGAAALTAFPESAETIGALLLLMTPSAMLAQVWTSIEWRGRSAASALGVGALIGMTAGPAPTSSRCPSSRCRLWRQR